jgi:type I restriction enzyme S subunit
MNGALPLGWRLATFSDVAHIAANLVDPKDFPNLPHIAPDNIERNTGRLLAYRTVKQDGVTSANHRFYPGQLLYSKIRPYLNKCVRVEFEGLCSADMYPLDPLIEPGYLHHYILTREFVNAVTKAAGSRTVLPKTNQKQLANVPVPVAPSEQQPAIVAAIESHFSRLDAAAATLERVQRNLERYRASVLKAAVEGRLVPTEADLSKKEGRSFEPASVLLKRILAERRRRWEEAELAKLKAKGKPPTDDRWKAKYEEPAALDTNGLPELPDGWCWATVDQLAWSIRNGCSTAPREQDGVRILRISAVRPLACDVNDVRFLPEPADNYEEFLLQPGDLLFTRYNGTRSLVGVCALVQHLPAPTVHPDKLIRVQILPGCDAGFVELATNVGASRKHVESRTRTTAGQAGVSGADIKSLPVPLPPAAEQARIRKASDELLTVASSLSATVLASFARSARTRQSILKWAFEGRLSDQHRGTTPAPTAVDNPATIRRSSSTEPSARR